MIFSIISILFVISCSPKRIHEKLVFENKHAKVFLESEIEKGSALNNYAHPVDLNDEILKLFLKSISYNEETGLFSKTQPASVFNENEINNLVFPIIDSLKKANPGQRIHFISYNRGNHGIFSHLRKTEGLVFIKPAGVLNIAFYSVNFEIRPHVNDDPVEIESEINPLKTRTAQTTVFSDIPEIKPHEFENGKKSPVWLAAHIDQLEMRLKTGDEKKKQKKVIILPEKGIEQPDAWELKKNKVTRQLKYIKELFSKGLITKEDYESKKKEILKQIN